MNKRLYRDEYHKVLGGVCSGLAEYFDMDVTVVRLLFAFTFFVMGVGFGTYIILWIVLPKKGYPYPGYNGPTVDYTVPPQYPGNQQFAQDNNQYTGNTFTGGPFNNNPFEANPAGVFPKQKSHAGIIFGTVLIIVGAAFLIDNFDLIPDFDLDKLWPVVLVLVGGALIASGQRKQPWENQNWQKVNNNEASANEDTASNDTTI
jgi:phage shock protein C